MFNRIKSFAKNLKSQLLVLYFASKDPKTPIILKFCMLIVLAYALSPIDLIPDFIPILGVLDDLIILPIGIWFCLKLIPKNVLIECQEKAKNAGRIKGKNWIIGSFIILLWGIILFGIGTILISKIF